MSNRARWTEAAYDVLVGNKPELANPGASLPLAKKCWKEPERSKSMKAEVPEDELQSYADALLEDKGLRQIRIPNGIYRWIKMNAPQGFQCWFFGLFGGWPDSLVMVPIGNYFLAVPIELKTQDKKGRAVGALHGKQKTNAIDEHWTIARSKEAFREAVERAERDAEKISKILVAQQS
jgi:hypothetical protein